MTDSARSWSWPAWRRVPLPVGLVAVVTAGLIWAAFDGTARPWIIGPGILLPDGAGASTAGGPGRTARPVSRPGG